MRIANSGSWASRPKRSKSFPTTQPNLARCPAPPHTNTLWIRQELPNWKNYMTLRSLDLYRGVENSVFTQWISPTPLLMIVALDDELASPDLALDAYAQAKEPKKLVLLPGNHFTPYTAEFSLTGNEARDWFTRHLVMQGSIALN
jgi:fermentation-respiration switch protein FrsA (DUF1100 family)